MFVVGTTRLALKQVDNPQAVCAYWNTAADAAAWMANISPERDAAIRFQHDVDISAGYMHSGYPIMTCEEQGRRGRGAQDGGGGGGRGGLLPARCGPSCAGTALELSIMLHLVHRLHPARSHGRGGRHPTSGRRRLGGE